MSRTAAALTAGAVGVLLIVGAGVAWYLGAGYVLLTLLPNSCDPNNSRLHALEKDPVAGIQVSGATVSRRFGFPATSAGGGHCASATYEIDFSTGDARATYEKAKAQVISSGWSLDSEGPAGDGRPFSSFSKPMRGWTASMDLAIEQGGGVLLVMRAPAVSS